MEVKHPEITVKLTGEDGNAVGIIGKVKRALPRDEQAQFMEEATSGNYDNVLQTCMRWVNVE